MKTVLRGSLEKKYFGYEPKEYDANALNWYNYMCDKKDYQDFMLKYLMKNKIKKKVPQNVRKSMAVIAHFLNTDRDIDDKHLKKLNEYIGTFEDKSPTIEQKDNTIKKPSIQERVQEQIIQYCGTIDSYIDDFLNTYDVQENTKKIKTLFKTIKGMQAKKIQEFYTRQLDDILINDDFAKEGYSFLGTHKKDYIKLLQTIIDETNNAIIMSVNKKRRPRKKKETPVYKKIQKFKFKESYKEQNIVSIHPEKIIDKKTLLAYDTKRKNVLYYESDDGFDIKGTSLLNVIKTFRKKIRKEDELFKKVNQRASKPSLLKYIKEEKTKEYENSPRFNENIIILKVW